MVPSLRVDVKKPIDNPVSPVGPDSPSNPVGPDAPSSPVGPDSPSNPVGPDAPSVFGMNVNVASSPMLAGQPPSVFMDTKTV